MELEGRGGGIDRSPTCVSCRRGRQGNEEGTVSNVLFSGVHDLKIIKVLKALALFQVVIKEARVLISPQMLSTS